MALRRRHQQRGFTLIELMTVVLIIAVLAALAMPSMLRAKDDQRAYAVAQTIAQTIREARARAIGTGGAQVISFTVGAGGTLTWLSSVDANNQEVGTCTQTTWGGAVVATGAGLRQQAGYDFGQNLDAQIGITTRLNTQTGVPAFGAICFAPSGKVFVATNLPGMANSGATVLSQVTAIDVSRTVSGGTTGITRAVVISPSGIARVISRTGA